VGRRAHAGRLTDFGCGVAGWATGFLIGLTVSCCHLCTADTLRQRHVLVPLITGVAGALAYSLLGRAFAPVLRADFELVALAGVAGTGAAAAASTLWPCSAVALGAIALVVAAVASAFLAPLFRVRAGAL
jgi:hypothetical protein